MLPYFILGVALLAGLLLAGRWFASADPKTLAKVLKWLLFGLIGAVLLFFLFRGQPHWALFTLPALLPWFLRLRARARAAKTFSRMAGASGGGGAGGGQASQVDTRFLRMSLDHDSATMDGEVKEGAFAGRMLSGLSLEELVALLQTCWVEDEQSAQVLEAYLDRAHEDWRDRVKAGGAGEAGGEGFAKGAMTRDEAYQILGLEAGASADEIKAAHHRLMTGLHPDHGGSTYLASKLNQAKDLLL